MAERRRQTLQASSAERLAPRAGAAPGDAGRAAWEWWWGGRLMALHGFPVERCPHGDPGEPRRRWRAGFASGTRAVAAAGHAARPAADGAPSGRPPARRRRG